MLLAGATNQTTTHSTSMAFASHPACSHIVNQKSPSKVQPQRSATWLTAPAARRKEENRLTPLPKQQQKSRHLPISTPSTESLPQNTGSSLTQEIPQSEMFLVRSRLNQKHYTDGVGSSKMRSSDATVQTVSLDAFCDRARSPPSGCSLTHRSQVHRRHAVDKHSSA